MTPVSLPVTPPVPNQATYSPADLWLFQTYTRASFLAAFGFEAPVYDPSQLTRNWFDTSASPGPYSCVQVNGSNASIVPLPVPKNVALPNLPGPFLYPAWVNPPTTTAMLQLPGEVPTPANPEFLCSFADAEAVLAALPAGSAVSEDPDDANINWGAETRRNYTVTIPGGPSKQYCQPLRAAMTHVITDPSTSTYLLGGVGSPGAFQLVGGAPQWFPIADPGLSAGPAMPVPVRPLAPGESLQSGILGAVQVVNANFGAPAAAGGGLTAAQATMLQRNNTILEALNTFFRLGV